MKKEILILIVGIIIGAVLSSTIFIIARPNYTRSYRPEFSNNIKFDKDRNRSEKRSGERPNRRNSNKLEENSTVNDAK